MLLCNMFLLRSIGACPTNLLVEFHTEKHNTEVFLCDIVTLITADENLFLPAYS